MDISEEKNTVKAIIKNEAVLIYFVSMSIFRNSSLIISEIRKSEINEEVIILIIYERMKPFAFELVIFGIKNPP